MRWSTLETTYEHDGVEYEVTYRYLPGLAGTMYARNGDPGDPPEPPEVDVISVVPCGPTDGCEPLTEDDEDLMEHCLRDAEEQRS